MYNRKELQEIAKKQEYVYVVVVDELEIVKYKTSEINFSNDGVMFNIKCNAPGIVVFSKEKEAKECLVYSIQDVIDDFKDEKNN